MSQGSTLAISLDEASTAFAQYAILAGTLNVTLGTTPVPTLGQTFQLLTYGGTGLPFASETGTFNMINLPPLDPGLNWNISQLYTKGSISAVPEPPVLSLLALGGLALKQHRKKSNPGKPGQRIHPSTR